MVTLKPGTFHISRTLTIPSFVVLRGSGSHGGPTGTTIAQKQDTAVLAIGAYSPSSPIFDGSSCHSGGYSTVVTVTENAIKETTQIRVNTASAAQISATPSSPAYAVIDEVDDGKTVNNTASSGFRRAVNRSTAQRIQIVGVDAKNGISYSGFAAALDIPSCSSIFGASLNRLNPYNSSPPELSICLFKVDPIWFRPVILEGTRVVSNFQTPPIRGLKTCERMRQFRGYMSQLQAVFVMLFEIANFASSVSQTTRRI